MLVGRGSRIAGIASQRDLVFASKNWRHWTGARAEPFPSCGQIERQMKLPNARTRLGSVLAQEAIDSGGHQSLCEPFADVPEPRPTIVAFLRSSVSRIPTQ
jgi:hypothetical protein